MAVRGVACRKGGDWASPDWSAFWRARAKTDRRREARLALCWKTGTFPRRACARSLYPAVSSPVSHPAHLDRNWWGRSLASSAHFCFSPQASSRNLTPKGIPPTSRLGSERGGRGRREAPARYQPPGTSARHCPIELTSLGLAQNQKGGLSRRIPEVMGNSSGACRSDWSLGFTQERHFLAVATLWEFRGGGGAGVPWVPRLYSRRDLGSRAKVWI